MQWTLLLIGKLITVLHNIQAMLDRNDIDLSATVHIPGNGGRNTSDIRLHIHQTHLLITYPQSSLTQIASDFFSNSLTPKYIFAGWSLDSN